MGSDLPALLLSPWGLHGSASRTWHSMSEQGQGSSMPLLKAPHHRGEAPPSRPAAAKAASALPPLLPLGRGTSLWQRGARSGDTELEATLLCPATQGLTSGAVGVGGNRVGSPSTQWAAHTHLSLPARWALVWPCCLQRWGSWSLHSASPQQLLPPVEGSWGSGIVAGGRGPRSLAP